jgi:hypothetical protein
MTHKQDAHEFDSEYLWDRSGQPDPETQKLESSLARFRHNGLPPAFEQFGPQAGRHGYSFSSSSFTPLRLAATALLAVTIGAASWLSLTSRPQLQTPTEIAWQVQLSVELPTTNNTNGAPPKNLWLQVGHALETDSDTTATLAVAQIGRLQLEPGSRLRLLQSHNGRQQVALDRGTMHATIWATPGQFVVDTPSAVAVDLGCMYTLHVDANGDGTLRTTLGWVGFHRDNHESFIPAGAACSTHRLTGPGTPYFEDASEAFRSALVQLDTAAAGSSEHQSALQVVLTQARARDVLTLWHLLARVSATDRPAIFNRLAQIVPPPENVTRDGILKLDRAMLDSWWNALDLGDISLWRHWERTWTGKDAQSR